jgi:hypothetical protein
MFYTTGSFQVLCFRRHNPIPMSPDASSSIVEGSGLTTVGCCPPPVIALPLVIPLLTLPPLGQPALTLLVVVAGARSLTTKVWSLPQASLH